MSLLQLMSTSAEPTAAAIRDPPQITAALAEHGARFLQWPLRYAPSTPDEETIRLVYAPEIELPHRGLRGRRPYVHPGRHPSMVRHGRSARLHRTAVLRNADRLARGVHW